MGTKESARHRALALIKDEHRSLAAVVHALQHLTKMLKQGKEINQTLLGAIAHYILQFPEKLHHPAEDKFIFTPLRTKTEEAKDVLNSLEAEHAAGDARANMMSTALNQLAARTPGCVEKFSFAVEEYARFYWAHMMTEETIVLPLAERMLSEEDWLEAAESFVTNHDSLDFADSPN